MTKQPTPEQQRRRRRAAFELRQRAGELLEDARMLDGLPALHLAEPELTQLADRLGVSAEVLADAVRALFPA